MFVIGIDVSKYKHDCIVLNDAGDVVIKQFTVANDRSGFNQLLSVINELDPSQEKRIGFESTGHYQGNLETFLENAGLPFMELNALLVHRFRGAGTLRGTKTDKADALLIARYLLQTDFKPYPPKAYHIHELDRLTKRRFDLVKQRTLYLEKITDWLDRCFPELKPFFGENLKSATAMFVLSEYGSPSRVAGMNQASFERLRRISKGRFSSAKFAELKSLAKGTVGTCYEVDEWELRSLLSVYGALQSEIDSAESLIGSALSKIDSKIPTIRGLGPVSCASIVAEIGDMGRFSSASKLLAYAGLDPRVYQSGTMEAQGRMNKKGSVVLRRVLMNAAEYLLCCSSVFYDYYRKKRGEGKPHRVAVSHCARKLVRIIYKVETEKIDFDPNMVR